MRQYVTKRLLLYFPTLILITLVIFLLMRVIPGDPAIQLLAAGGDASYTEEDLAKKRHDLGIDRPLVTQYFTWIGGMLRGDMGKALYYQRPVKEELSPRIPITFEIAILAMIISLLVAVPLGIFSAIAQDSVLDYIGRAVTIFGISIPIFVTGIVSIYILARVFNWLPPLGYTPLWEDPWQNMQQIFFPALTLAIFQMNFTARVTRSAMLEVLREDYIRTARSKGLQERLVIVRHALKNAMLPILGVAGWSLAILLGGSVIIEQIFVIPGLGRLLIESIGQRDYTLVQGVVIVFSVTVLTVNLVVDLALAWIDPRIRYA